MNRCDAVKVLFPHLFGRMKVILMIQISCSSTKLKSFLDGKVAWSVERVHKSFGSEKVFFFFCVLNISSLEG